MSELECFDVTIIGGGPAGLFSAFYSGLRELKTKIIESQPTLGGKIQIYPEKMIWDVGGLTPITGARLREQLIEQGLTFQPTVVLNQKIVSIKQNQDKIFILKPENGQEHLSKTVVVAIGSGIINPQKLKIEGAERFEVTNLHYTVDSLKSFKDKTVLISGGGNSAIDWANELEPFAKKVFLTYRSQLSGHEAQIKQLLNSSVECFPATYISKLIANDQHDAIHCVELKQCKKNEIIKVEVDEVIINHGFDIDSTLLNKSELNINLVDEFYIEGTPMSESSINGLYGAGDILKYDGKLNLIAGAFQDAANAINKAKQYIEPRANATAMVSSHNDILRNRNREILNRMMQE